MYRHSDPIQVLSLLRCDGDTNAPISIDTFTNSRQLLKWAKGISFTAVEAVAALINLPNGVYKIVHGESWYLFRNNVLIRVHVG